MLLIVEGLLYTSIELQVWMRRMVHFGSGDRHNDPAPGSEIIGLAEFLGKRASE